MTGFFAQINPRRRRRRRRRNPKVEPWMYAAGAAAVLGVGYLLLRKKKEEPREALPAPEPAPTLEPVVIVDYETYPEGTEVVLEPRAKKQLTVLPDCSVVTVPLPWWDETSRALFEAHWGAGVRDPGAMTDLILEDSLGEECPQTDAVAELRQNLYKRVVREFQGRGVPLEAHFEMQEE